VYFSISCINYTTSLMFRDQKFWPWPRSRLETMTSASTLALNDLVWVVVLWPKIS